MNALDRFSLYHHIWKEDREETIQKFIQGNPLLSEFESQILYYRDLELEINAEPECVSVGALALYTGKQTLNQQKCSNSDRELSRKSRDVFIKMAQLLIASIQGPCLLLLQLFVG